MTLNLERLKELLAEALALPKAERPAFVERSCEGNAELRTELERLMAAHESAGSFLEHTAVPPEPDIHIEKCGCFIGRYKLLQEIGEGGFGRVFLAEQTELVHRKVALKIVKAGMDTREVIARFEAERQALALMEHPNIARVLDAGTTDAGRPYFVMELVNGMPVTSYCDRHNLPLEARLQLFIKVCHAVQHAHQKGVIHRDLKPSNILVTMIDGEPVPKIIDFGIAKALGQRLTEKTLFTAFQTMVGTPIYMSPEQAELSGVDVDTRSDIYALGVLLYELLTGVTPFDGEILQKAALDEVRRVIREVEPPKPSTRLRTLGGKVTEVAQHRQTVPAALTRLLHGDLDWIVMKALEKNRTRRYETVGSLVEDIQRHLRHEPVQAGPPGVMYRAGKFMRRHRVGVGMAAALAMVGLLGITSVVVGLLKVSRERDRALLAEQAAQSERDRAVAAEQQTREERDRTLHAEAAQVETLHAFADLNVGIREIIPLLEEGVRMAREKNGSTNEAYLRLLQMLASSYGTVGEWDKALVHYETLIKAMPNDNKLWWLAYASALATGDRGRAQGLSAGMLAQFGSSPTPESPTRVALALLLSSDSPSHVRTAAQLANSAVMFPAWRLTLQGIAAYCSGQYVEAEALLKQARTPVEPKLYSLPRYFRAMALHQQGKTKEAQEILADVNRCFTKTLRTGDLGSQWQHTCLSMAARAEAERLILGRETSPPVTAEFLTLMYQDWKAVEQRLQNGLAMAREGKWEQSARQFSESLRNPAFEWETARNIDPGCRLDLIMGLAFAKVRDNASRDQLGRHLLNYLDSTSAPIVGVEKFLRVCFLTPDSLPPDLQQRGFELVRLAETNRTQHPYPHWLTLSLGIAKYRAGGYPGSVELLRESAAVSTRNQWGSQITGRGQSLAYQAMALKQMGRTPEARETLAEARELVSEPIQNRAGADWLELELSKLALGEAQGVINP